MDLIQLVYVSAATRPMSEDDLVALLAQARERNARQDITGLLLYKDSAFIQVLEGRRADVEAVYASIRRDPRNSGNYVLENEAIAARRFPDWRMGFRDLTREAPEGYSEFLVRPEQGERQRDTLLALLRKF